MHNWKLKTKQTSFVKRKHMRTLEAINYTKDGKAIETENLTVLFISSWKDKIVLPFTWLSLCKNTQ